MAITQEERTALALSALGEVTDPNDVGELLGVVEVEDGVIDLRFACRLAAYAGWHWTVSTSDLPDGDVTVLEVELLPGDGALLAPPWVPWTERLADWRAQHPDEAHPDDVADDEDSDDEDADLDDADLDDAEEDDLAVDDELDELDETELEGAMSPEESEQDSVDDDDDDDGSEEESEPDASGAEDPSDEDWDEDVRGPRPGEVDRSL